MSASGKTHIKWRPWDKKARLVICYDSKPSDEAEAGEGCDDAAGSEVAQVRRPPEG